MIGATKEQQQNINLKIKTKKLMILSFAVEASICKRKDFQLHIGQESAHYFHSSSSP